MMNDEFLRLFHLSAPSLLIDFQSLVQQIRNGNEWQKFIIHHSSF